ncbi:MerR family transcriptional regulator [Lichenifustis flavocetrariae]|uniref:MerR family transcriptional regulator n=1 Tax=Lichenifustis flavocetrariae TaxID=2949735 RepID=A0AA41Z5A0_9HYPH|nr:MerR family transcriptional regulator [Lichenifustis flavocetrariae]MCW6510733.1 MerR family transcriptional regulator [Lichenifustis flavocetrariae]
MEKDADAFRTISEVAAALGIPPHVLRFWETKFPQVKPLKRGGGRRYYRRADTELLSVIRRLLYEDGYTIRGVQRLLKTQGPAAVAALPPGQVPESEDSDSDASDQPDLVERVQSVEMNEAPKGFSQVLTHLISEIASCRRLLDAALSSDP